MSDATEDGMEGTLADLIGFALAARPERVEDAMLALAPPEVRLGVRWAREALAVLGLAEAPAAPRQELRVRLMGTLGGGARRAVVVLDMIRDHLEPGALLEVPRARAVVGALGARLDAARAAGIPVVYVVDAHDPDDPDLDAWGTHAVKGTSGAEVWPELAPREGDHVVTKPSYSGFFGSELGGVLDALAVDTVVLTGCLTEIGIMATATDALQLGYAVEVPPDSQAGSCEEMEQAALRAVAIMAPFGPARRARLERAGRLAA